MCLRDDFSKFIQLCHTGKGSKSFNFILFFSDLGLKADILLAGHGLIGPAFELLDTFVLY